MHIADSHFVEHLASRPHNSWQNYRNYRAYRCFADDGSGTWSTQLMWGHLSLPGNFSVVSMPLAVMVKLDIELGVSGIGAVTKSRWSKIHPRPNGSKREMR